MKLSSTFFTVHTVLLGTVYRGFHLTKHRRINAVDRFLYASLWVRVLLLFPDFLALYSLQIMITLKEPSLLFFLKLSSVMWYHCNLLLWSFFLMEQVCKGCIDQFMDDFLDVVMMLLRVLFWETKDNCVHQLEHRFLVNATKQNVLEVVVVWEYIHQLKLWIFLLYAGFSWRSAAGHLPVESRSGTQHVPLPKIRIYSCSWSRHWKNKCLTAWYCPSKHWSGCWKCLIWWKTPQVKKYWQ